MHWRSRVFRRRDYGVAASKLGGGRPYFLKIEGHMGLMIKVGYWGMLYNEYIRDSKRRLYLSI